MALEGDTFGLRRDQGTCGSRTVPTSFSASAAPSSRIQKALQQDCRRRKHATSLFSSYGPRGPPCFGCPRLPSSITRNASWQKLKQGLTQRPSSRNRGGPQQPTWPAHPGNPHHKATPSRGDCTGVERRDTLPPRRTNTPPLPRQSCQTERSGVGR